MLIVADISIEDVCKDIKISEDELQMILSKDEGDFLQSEKYEILKRSIEKGGRYRLHPVYRTYFADLETGKVYSIREHNVAELRPTYYPNGYGYLTLMGKRRVYVHRIVMECFLGELINDNYGDRVTHHCEYPEFGADSLYNLRLVTRPENGKMRHRKKYTRRKYKAYRIYKGGTLIYNNIATQLEVASILDVDSSTVAHHLDGHIETIKGCVVVGVVDDVAE